MQNMIKEGREAMKNFKGLLTGGGGESFHCKGLILKKDGTSNMKGGGDLSTQSEALMTLALQTIAPTICPLFLETLILATA